MSVTGPGYAYPNSWSGCGPCPDCGYLCGYYPSGTVCLRCIHAKNAEEAAARLDGVYPLDVNMNDLRLVLDDRKRLLREAKNLQSRFETSAAVLRAERDLAIADLEARGTVIWNDKVEAARERLAAAKKAADEWRPVRE